MAETITHGDNYARSDESTMAEIGIGKAEGAAYGAALQYLAKMEASDSGEREIGDYVIAYSIEEAEGMYEPTGAQLQWHDPEKENCHMEIAVRNAADGRFVPCLKVQATLTDVNGAKIGTHEIPFLWHPWVYHYGRNWVVPHDGAYRLQVHIDAPTFSRHDKKNGHRFATAVDVEFDVKIKTGRKISSAEKAA
jgi:uncharacterized protein involved in high-affinity Fe2+ transport